MEYIDLPPQKKAGRNRTPNPLSPAVYIALLLSYIVRHNNKNFIVLSEFFDLNRSL